MRHAALLLAVIASACGPQKVTGSNRGELFVSIVGVDGEPALEITHDVGAVAVGSSTQLTVRAINVGRDSMHVFGATLGAVGNGSWFVRDTSGELAPEASLSVNVTFAPVEVGPQATTLTFSHDAAASTPVVRLTGAGR